MTTTDTETTITNAARSCAQGWAEQVHGEAAREWTGDLEQGDLDYLRMEVLRRDETADEARLFDRIFREEYAACMEQRAAREGWT